MEELIIPYLNHSLNDSDKNRFILHIAECKNCQESLAVMLKLQKELQKRIIEMPDNVKLHVYDKIKNQKPRMEEEIIKIFTKRIPLPRVSVEITNYVMSIIKQDVKKLFKTIKEAELCQMRSL